VEEAAAVAAGEGMGDVFDERKWEITLFNG
jgi:hypothetical protein